MDGQNTPSGGGYPTYRTQSPRAQSQTPTQYFTSSYASQSHPQSQSHPRYYTPGPGRPYRPRLQNNRHSYSSGEYGQGGNDFPRHYTPQPHRPTYTPSPVRPRSYRYESPNRFGNSPSPYRRGRGFRGRGDHGHEERAPIEAYFSEEMLRDPWENMTPVVVERPQFITI